MGVEEVALHVPRPSGGAPFELRVRRLPPLRGGLGRAARAMLVIEQPEPEQRIDGWSVGKLYGHDVEGDGAGGAAGAGAGSAGGGGGAGDVVSDGAAPFAAHFRQDGFAPAERPGGG